MPLIGVGPVQWRLGDGEGDVDMSCVGIRFFPDEGDGGSDGSIASDAEGDKFIQPQMCDVLGACCYLYGDHLVLAALFVLIPGVGEAYMYIIIYIDV
jgi:hypothetical protein